MDNASAAALVGEHRFPVRIYFEDTDAAGIVYHANYLRFAERARTEMLRLVGLSNNRLLEEDGVAIAVRQCLAEFLAPARLDDALMVHTQITHVGGATLAARQDVRRDGSDLVRMSIKLACMTPDGRAARLPATVRRICREIMEGKVSIDPWTQV